MKWTELEPKVVAIEGYLCEGQEQWLYESAANLASKSRILEIGCYKGRSTSCLYGGAQESDSDLTSIDICAQHAEWTLASINATFGTSVKFRQIVGSSVAEIPTLFMNGERFDLVFVDGHHLFPIVSCDILNSFHIINPKGRIAVHDYTETWPEVMQSWNLLGPLFHSWSRCSTIVSGLK